MNTRHVLGQRIVKVRHTRSATNTGLRVSVLYVELANGVRLIPFARETETEPIGDITVNMMRKRSA